MSSQGSRVVNAYSFDIPSLLGANPTERMKVVLSGARDPLTRAAEYREIGDAEFNDIATSLEDGALPTAVNAFIQLVVSEVLADHLKIRALPSILSTVYPALTDYARTQIETLIRLRKDHLERTEGMSDKEVVETSVAEEELTLMPYNLKYDSIRITIAPPIYAECMVDIESIRKVVLKWLRSIPSNNTWPGDDGFTAILFYME